MLESMNKLIADLKLIPRGSTVLCAVSGGADSICLLHALYHLRPRLDFSLAVAHYDHQLRGEESKRDAAFVAQFVSLCCGRQRLEDGKELPAVPLYSGSEDVAKAAKERGTGIEETARDLRYAFLRETAQRVGADRIAVAHTADDNVETVLFHLARGSGLRGLTGIQPVRGEIIRPLLTTTRREVEDYLAYHGMPHIEDHSNDDDTYARNRIRHQVTPVLEAICPGFAARMTDTTALLRADEEYLTSQGQVLADQAVETGERLTVSAALIGKAPDPVAVRALRLLIGRRSGGDQDCGSAHLTALLRLCRGKDPSAELHLPDGLTVRREYENLVLTREAAPAPLEPERLALPGETMAGKWRLTCTAGAYGGQPQGPWDFWLDREKVPELTVRSRTTGDQLRLPGRPQKTVKKWCVDEKIPAVLRGSLPLLEREGHVAAVAGLGPDVNFLPEAGADAWRITITAL